MSVDGRVTDIRPGSTLGARGQLIARSREGQFAAALAASVLACAGGFADGMCLNVAGHGNLLQMMFQPLLAVLVQKDSPPKPFTQSEFTEFRS